ncbi:hypothetical protein OEA41_001434 [Lepraria neglecta]|uniref:Uncharacterized protein n=1 Tax=Lepraria neglecta TaxID=209136 RepID=A0AAD9Z9Q6_9LECA|nr:hypothetical protein OEA41_001434 [Lepraria neglecta]
MTGEEAFAARRAMAAMPTLHTAEIKTEGRWQHDLFEQENIAPITPAESRASSFLASIPQWQPPSTRFDPSPSASDGYQPQSRSQAPASNPPKITGRWLFPDVIPAVDGLDKLDRAIGIRPRAKRSTEVQFVLSAQFHNNGKQLAFPAAMMVITHQFMVANRFLLWQSLLVRLDLHETSELSRKQKTYLGKVTTRLDRYLITRAIEWKAAGIYLEPTNGAVLAFHECTRAWLRKDWDGAMAYPLRSTTAYSFVPTAANLSESDIARIADRMKA